MLQNLHRMGLQKWGISEINELVDKTLASITQSVQANSIYLFGSAVSGNFDDWSDLDFLLVFPNLHQADQGRRKLYSIPQKFGWRCEFICVDQNTFDKKSNLGGIIFVAVTEGRKIL